MTSERFDDVLRGLAAGASRRSALGALVGAALAAALPGASDARRLRDPRRRKGKHRRQDDDRQRNRKRDKNRKHRDRKSKGCKSNHSEKEILNFIAKAAKKYGQSRGAMERVARCESSLDPCAVNRSGPYYGLFQFLKSTWKTTPYKDKSIYDPKAQALAAAWMWKQGRKNEWACK